MSIPIRCPQAVVTQTIEAIRRGGYESRETLVFWLGRKHGGIVEVIEAYIPPQQAEIDWFRVPPESMRVVMQHLRQRRAHICAQVHSHPGLAFHSEADDEWALIRHRGALSLVVPHFGRTTSADNFLASTAVYALSDADCWERVPGTAIHTVLAIVSHDT